MRDEISFIDTNILVYAFDRSEAEKNKKARPLLQKCFKGELGLATSTQVLSEFFLTVTKKIPKPIAGSQAKDIVQKITEFKEFPVLTIKPATVVAAINSHNKTKAHYWDALIAQTMKENDIFHIYTENTADFKKISGIEAVNPLH